MKRTPLLTAAASAVLFFSSCKNSSDTGINIPKDASIAVHINSSSLSSKLSWEEIKSTNWFKEMYSEAKDSLAQKILTDPEASGIDTKAPLAFFMKKQGKGGYGVFEGTIKDAAAFEAFLKKAGNNGEVKKEGDWSFMNTREKGVASWNSSKFAFIVDMPMLGMPGAYSYASTADGSFPVDSLKKFVTGALTLKSDNSLNDDERFTSLLKEEGDVHLWMNSEKLYSGMVGGVMSMMKLNSLFEGNVSASTLNFDAGKITMKSKQYYGEELTELIKKYEPKPVTADVINRIPSQNVIGAFVMNYPPEGWKAFIKMAGFDGMINAFLGKYNYNFDELMAACKGQMLIAATDFTIKQEKQTFEGTDYTYTSNKPDVKMLFALSVNNKASFDKLIGIAQSEMNNEAGQKALSQISYKVNNDWFAISNSAETVDRFLAGGNNKLPFTDKISGHPFGLYIDIQKIMKSAQPTATDASSLSAFEASMKLWQDVVMTGGEIKDGAVTAEFTVNLIDKKTNSLKQINQYIEQLAALKKSQQAGVEDIKVEEIPMAADTAAAQ
jgi:hypothetical protein